MTYREKLEKEHPEAIIDHVYGGCAGCPSTYGYSKDHGLAPIREYDTKTISEQ